jgi:hypothetical protein
VPVGDGGVSQGLPTRGARTAHSLGLVRDGGSHDGSLRTEVSGLSATNGERDVGNRLNGRCGVRSWGFSLMAEFITFSWCGDNGGAARVKPHLDFTEWLEVLSVAVATAVLQSPGFESRAGTLNPPTLSTADHSPSRVLHQGCVTHSHRHA